MARLVQGRGLAFVAGAGAVVGSLLTGGISVADAARAKPKANIATDVQCSEPCVDAAEISGTVSDADNLDGQDSTAFLGAADKATDADKLDGQDSTAFLGAADKATDADKLDGQDSTAFARKVKTDTLTVTAQPNLAPSECVSYLDRSTLPASTRILDQTTDYVVAAPPSAALAVSGAVSVGADGETFPGSGMFVHVETVTLQVCNIATVSVSPNRAYRYMILR